MYSQYDEEKHILAAFEPGYKGRFLDVGAFHPMDKSNTRALFEKGWTGVMFEPSPGPMRNLLAAYGKDGSGVMLISAAVGIESGLLNLHVTNDAVSTASEAEYGIWKNATGWYGKMLVPVMTLPEITNQFGGFDFINLDAEGISGELLLKALEIGLEPHCFCVEHDGRTTELLERATAKGYRCTYSNSTNIVLVK